MSDPSHGTEQDAPGEPTVIACRHCGCQTAMAHVVLQEGQPALEIVSRHHGERHRLVLTAGELAVLLDELKAEEKCAPRCCTRTLS